MILLLRIHKKFHETYFIIISFLFFMNFNYIKTELSGIYIIKTISNEYSFIIRNNILFLSRDGSSFFKLIKNNKNSYYIELYYFNNLSTERKRKLVRGHNIKIIFKDKNFFRKDSWLDTSPVYNQQRVWISLLVPTCSTMISSDEPWFQGFIQSYIQIP